MQQIRYRSIAQIRKDVREFLQEYHTSDTIPVPIEEIIEFDLGLDIFPLLDLKRNYGIDGAMSQDFSIIYVDQFIYDQRENRYRFTLAHEVGHFILHKYMFDKEIVTDLDGWVAYAQKVASEGGWLENEAHEFARQVLMPQHHLEVEIERFMPEIESLVTEAHNYKIQRSSYVDRAVGKMAEKLAQVFQVSEIVAKIRLDKESFHSRVK